MKKIILLFSVFFIFGIGIFVSCKQSDSKKDKESIIKGTATLLVDETIKPIIEDQIAVFESTYDAKIVLDAKSEKEVIQTLIKDSTGLVVLSRPLNSDEIKFFGQFKIKPKTTKFATDAIALISNKKDTDTLIAMKDVVAFLKGQPQTKIKGLVFDNPNSSTVRYIKDLAGVKGLPKNGVFSFKTNEEVIKFVSENDGMIGIVGVNWLSQPSASILPLMKKINVLSVKGLKDNQYYSPTQNDIAEMKYPLARDLYIINCQGYSGLGMGFSSFIAGDIGQRIILKSGLLPIRVPGRKLQIRSQIINDKE